MRELRENVRYRPARDRYKIFIVDEAHQITSEAFNALLKTLEEPPEWVVFILCTTESHKIPTTIASRCQQFSFRSVDFAELIERMQWICEQEGIEADPEALACSRRRAKAVCAIRLSALDQAIACCGAKLDAHEVRELLGMFSLDSLDQVTQALTGSDSRRMLEVVAELEAQRPQSAALLPRARALFPESAGGENRGPAISVAWSRPRRPSSRCSREIAAQFSEEDLTRYLQLSLDLFKDLQKSLQPRLHLEIGLLRLVHAGRIAVDRRSARESRLGRFALAPAENSAGSAADFQFCRAVRSARRSGSVGIHTTIGTHSSNRGTAEHIDRVDSGNGRPSLAPARRVDRGQASPHRRRRRALRNCRTRQRADPHHVKDVHDVPQAAWLRSSGAANAAAGRCA